MDLKDAGPYIALYGAVVSTLVFAWNLVTWLTANRLQLFGRVNPNNYTADSAMTRFVAITIVNRGQVPTQLTNIRFVGYPNWIYRLLGRGAVSALPFGLVTADPSIKLPYKLDRGGSFECYVQAAQLIELSKRMRTVHCHVAHSMDNNDLRIRARIQ